MPICYDKFIFLSRPGPTIQKWKPSWHSVDGGRLLLCSKHTPSLAASFLVLDLLRAQRDSSFASLCTGGRRLRLHSGLDLGSHGQKRLFNIRRGLGGSLQKFNAQRIGEFLALLGGYDTLGGQVGLVTDQQFVDVLRGVSVNFV